LHGDCLHDEPDELDESVYERVETPEAWGAVGAVADWSSASPSVARRPVLGLEAFAFYVRFGAGASPGASWCACVRPGFFTCRQPIGVQGPEVYSGPLPLVPCSAGRDRCSRATATHAVSHEPAARSL